MRKVLITLLLFVSLFTLASCKKDDKPLEGDAKGNIINVSSSDEIKIMQLTDLHYTYGFDGLDRKTDKLLKRLVDKENPDVIVVTGDIVMTLIAKRLIKNFVKTMDSFQIPWTIAFGNHEREFHSIESIVNLLVSLRSDYLYFDLGMDGFDYNKDGASNFKLKLYNDNNHLINLYILDSKANHNDKDLKDNPYDYFSNKQVTWFNDELSSDNVLSLAFFHMPNVEFLEYDGELGEKMWPQAKDTGFFDAIRNNDYKVKGIFVGHDHLNSFQFMYEGVLHAYGMSSGYNAYGKGSKGARIITITNITNNSFDLDSYVVLDKDVK